MITYVLPYARFALRSFCLMFCFYIPGLWLLKKLIKDLNLKKMIPSIKPSLLCGVLTVSYCRFSSFARGSVVKARSSSRPFNTNYKTDNPTLIPFSREPMSIFQMSDSQFGQYLAGFCTYGARS